MKALIFLAIVLTSCSTMRPVCHLDRQRVVIIGYVKFNKTYQCEDLNKSCYGSFRCDTILSIGDTVYMEVERYGSIASNQIPFVEIKRGN